MTDSTENQNQEDVNYEALDQSHEVSQDQANTNQDNQEHESRGYQTREQWIASGKDPSKHKSKEEFDEFGKSYSILKPHIDKFKNELRNKDLAIEAVVKNLEEIKKSEYLRGKQEIEHQLRQAREVGDVNAIEELAVRKVALDNQAQSDIIVKQQQEEQRVNQVFMERNGHWFNDNHADLKWEAVAEDNRLKQLYPTLSYEQRVLRVEDHMRFKHPELGSVQTPNDTRISSNSSAVNKSAVGQSQTEENLYRRLSSKDREDFKSIKKLVERVPGVRYTVKDFIEQETKYNKGN